MTESCAVADLLMDESYWNFLRNSEISYGREANLQWQSLVSYPDFLRNFLKEVKQPCNIFLRLLPGQVSLREYWDTPRNHHNGKCLTREDRFVVWRWHPTLKCLSWFVATENVQKVLKFSSADNFLDIVSVRFDINYFLKPRSS